MNKLIRIFILSIFCIGLYSNANAQAVINSSDTTKLVFDDLQVDLYKVTLDSNAHTLTVDLFLISYTDTQRELKLNTFGTTVIDTDGQSHLFAQIGLGKVTVKFADKQNYLHYLLEEDKPTALTVVIADWQKAKPKSLNLVFESSTEEGQFVKAIIPLDKKD